MTDDFITGAEIGIRRFCVMSAFLIIIIKKKKKVCVCVAVET